jgi:RNA polymerase sigma-70 factor (ECF subfamily)
MDDAWFQVVTCLSRRTAKGWSSVTGCARDHERPRPSAVGEPHHRPRNHHVGDDAELTAAVLAAQNGDETAFRAVYRSVHPRLLGYVRTLVGDLDAEDVTSESWLQIARDLERFSGDADRFRGWAARIARNRALDHIRMRGRRPVAVGDETELTGRAAESDTAGEAMEALATGRTLGKRPGAVRTAAHRGLRKLAELLGEDPDTAGVLDALPAQRRPRGRAVSSGGVTHACAPTQKDM